MDNFAGRIHSAIAAVAPVSGVSIGRRNDKSTWRVNYRADATPEQIAAGNAVLAGFSLLDFLKADLARRITADAEACRLQFVTPGSAKAMEYLEKRDQANAVHAMGEEAARAMSEADAIAQFPTLASGLGLDGDDMWEVALTIIAQAEAWADVSYVIARLERMAKAAIASAPMLEAAQAAYETIEWPRPQ